MSAGKLDVAFYLVSSGIRQILMLATRIISLLIENQPSSVYHESTGGTMKNRCTANEIGLVT
jgi:hypothetical protein